MGLTEYRQGNNLVRIPTFVSDHKTQSQTDNLSQSTHHTLQICDFLFTKSKKLICHILKRDSFIYPFFYSSVKVSDS